MSHIRRNCGPPYRPIMLFISLSLSFFASLSSRPIPVMCRYNIVVQFHSEHKDTSLLHLGIIMPGRSVPRSVLSRAPTSFVLNDPGGARKCAKACCTVRLSDFVLWFFLPIYGNLYTLCSVICADSPSEGGGRGRDRESGTI
uniref:Putative secreted peptide n=1 Tax=Anopheles braziliensis TaxID=58242 RepID=A0A2M3ZU98_9DIPT